MALDAEQIRSILNFDRIYFRPEIDSTNEWAKREAKAGAADGSIYLADHQSAGKGRRGRVWQSPPDTSVAMSILRKPDIPKENFPMLTLVMGLSAAEGIRGAGGPQAGIKWPNDVVWENKKLCGILTELAADGSSVIIGTGLNINMQSFPDELSDKAVSLAMACGHSFSREEVTACVIRRFQENYALFCETGDFRNLKERYEAMLLNRGKRVRVLDPKEPFSGTAAGIDERGRLLVKREDTGNTEAVFSGEVSVRGIYGYAV